jgi:hypothetical protein
MIELDEAGTPVELLEQSCGQFPGFSQGPSQMPLPHIVKHPEDELTGVTVDEEEAPTPTPTVEPDPRLDGFRRDHPSWRRRCRRRP